MNVSSLTDEQKSYALSNVWVPSCTYAFHLDKDRKFRFEWLNIFPWLVYSQKQDGAFCINCMLFGSQCKEVHNTSKLQRLYTSPFNNMECSAFEIVQACGTVTNTQSSHIMCSSIEVPHRKEIRTNWRYARWDEKATNCETGKFQNQLLAQLFFVEGRIFHYMVIVMILLIICQIKSTVAIALKF